MTRLRGMLTGGEFDPAHATGTVRIAVSDYMTATLGAEILGAFAAQAPGMSCEITPVGPSTFEDVEPGHVDIAYGPTEPPAPLRREVLFTDERVCVLAADHPLAASRLTAQDLDDYPALRVAALEGGHTPLARDPARSATTPTPPSLTVPYFTAGLSALPGTTLVAVLPRRLVERHASPEVRVADGPAGLPPFDHAMIWHPRSARDPTHRWLRSLLTATSAVARRGADDPSTGDRSAGNGGASAGPRR